MFNIKTRSNIREIVQYNELFIFLVWKEIKIKYKQSLLGIGWAVIQPLALMLLFTGIFGKIAQIPSDGVPYAVFSYSALLPWSYFAAVLSLSANSLIANTSLLTKIYFPRIILPTASVLSGLLDFCIASILLAIIMIIYGVIPNHEILYAPLFLFSLVMFTLGISLLLSAMNVKFRDVKYVVPFMLQFLMFTTPIIYPLSMVSQSSSYLLALNPLTGIIDGFRASIIPSIDIQWEIYAISMFVNLVIFITGIIFFNRTERTFADIV